MEVAMEFLELAKSRYSERFFDSKPIEDFVTEL